MSVRDTFNFAAKDYDKFRRNFIPCFDDFYGTVVKIIAYQNLPKLVVLDLGAGTGLLSDIVLSNFPDAEIDLIDISENMLDLAKKRFETAIKKKTNQINFLIKDFSSNELLELPKSYNIIMSALSIHHLTTDGKKAFFSKILSILPPGGIFINADLCRGTTPAIEDAYNKIWLNQIKKSGLSDEEIEAGIKRSNIDIKETVEDQLKWLRESRFANVNCWYSNLRFAVYSGQKPT